MKVEMKNITKRFGPVLAVDNVDFETFPGEVHGLMGENGAGKTTLMNILSGTIEATSGDVYIDGRLVEDMTPAKASAMGLRFIHQELNLCTDLRVYENMFLHDEISRFGFVNKKEMIKRCAEVFERMKVDIDPTAVVSDLETSKKQLVEIARALLFKSEFIIMDEPTTSLNNEEISNLFEIMRSLKEEGVTFIYISHKMPELFEICDRYIVMRDGKLIETGFYKDIDENRATELLVGRMLVHTDLKEAYPPNITGEVLLSVDGLCGKSFRDISFDIRRGEIISFTGLQGSGIEELAEALFGAAQITAGTVKTADNITMQRVNIKNCMDKGIAMVPRNRKERGILADLSILDNISMAFFTAKQKNIFVHKKDENERFKINQEKLNIKVGDAKDEITSLSGGNQQKVIIGRWLEIDADVYILDAPTQGIDVGAKFEIYRLILEMAKAGKAIIVFSNEYPEIAHITDRCLVMYKGELNADIQRDDMEEMGVMYYATGANKEAARQ